MKEIFKSKRLMPFLALICASLWALAYPFIKLGYAELGIASADLGGKVLFAGVRFFSAGALVLLISHRQPMEYKKNEHTWQWLILFGIVNTTLHYLFTYVGLGYIPGSRGTLINSMGTFFLIILSTLIYADDKPSVNKAIGCVLGFGGIIFMNVGAGGMVFDNISFLGDGMIILCDFCSAFGGIIGRKVSKKMNMTVATGLSMTFGGALLILIGVMVGPDKAWNMSLKGVGIFIVLILISAISFSIYNQLLANHPISKVAVFNALIPVFGVIFSCIILSEPFEVKYIVAGAMVTVGIIIANRVRRKEIAG